MLTASLFIDYNNMYDYMCMQAGQLVSPIEKNNNIIDKYLKISGYLVISW